MNLAEIMYLPLFCWSSFSSIPAPFARKSRCLHFCLHNEVRVLSNILSHSYAYPSVGYFLYIDIISDVHKDLSSVRMENWNRKYKSKANLSISWINLWGRFLKIRISLHKGNKICKRSISSFDDFSAKHTPCATLKWREFEMIL